MTLKNRFTKKQHALKTQERLNSEEQNKERQTGQQKQKSSSVYSLIFTASTLGCFMLPPISSQFKTMKFAARSGVGTSVAAASLLLGPVRIVRRTVGLSQRPGLVPACAQLLPWPSGLDVENVRNCLMVEKSVDPNVNVVLN